MTDRKLPKYPFEGPPPPLPADPDMPMWKTLVEDHSNGFTRQVKALGSDETGYVVSVIEDYQCAPLQPFPGGIGVGIGVPTHPPRSFEVFIPLTAEQIVSIFSYRGDRE